MSSQVTPPAERAKELFAYVREIYAEEIARFHRLDQKASWLFSALAIFLGFASLSAHSVLQHLAHPTTWMDFAFGLSGALLFACTIFAWYQLLQVLRLKDLMLPSISDEMIALFQKNDDISQIFHALVNRYNENLPKIQRSTTTKTTHIQRAYTAMRISILLFSIMAITYFLTLFQETSK